MRDQRGFTLTEIVLVLLIGGLLTAIAVNTFGRAQHRMATRSAESQFVTMHAHTRALAVERGDVARLVVDANQNRVSIVLGLGGGQTVRTVDFMEHYDVGIQTAGSPLELCMNPRGFADQDCNTFENVAEITFQRMAQARSVRLLPMGQLLR